MSKNALGRQHFASAHMPRWPVHIYIEDTEYMNSYRSRIESAVSGLAQQLYQKRRRAEEELRLEISVKAFTDKNVRSLYSCKEFDEVMTESGKFPIQLCAEAESSDLNLAIEDYLEAYKEHKSALENDGIRDIRRPALFILSRGLFCRDCRVSTKVIESAGRAEEVCVFPIVFGENNGDAGKSVNDMRRLRSDRRIFTGGFRLEEEFADILNFAEAMSRSAEAYFNATFDELWRKYET